MTASWKQSCLMTLPPNYYLTAPNVLKRYGVPFTDSTSHVRNVTKTIWLVGFLGGGGIPQTTYNVFFSHSRMSGAVILQSLDVMGTDGSKEDQSMKTFSLLYQTSTVHELRKVWCEYYQLPWIKTSKDIINSDVQILIGLWNRILVWLNILEKKDVHHLFKW